MGERDPEGKELELEKATKIKNLTIRLVAISFSFIAVVVLVTLRIYYGPLDLVPGVVHGVAVAAGSTVSFVICGFIWTYAYRKFVPEVSLTKTLQGAFRLWFPFIVTYALITGGLLMNKSWQQTVIYLFAGAALYIGIYPLLKSLFNPNKPGQQLHYVTLSRFIISSLDVFI